MSQKLLTKKQFAVLEALASATERLSQRNLESATRISLGTINKIISEFTSLGYIENGKITEKGLLALEPYRVKRAIFIAAGFGSRLVPITLNTPKPLVRVNGKRIIDGLLDACLKAEIEEIYIVRGYLAEQFDQLLYKYPMIKFLENPKYNESNNISSALCAKDLLCNAYVLESDLLITNHNIIKKYCYSSNFLGIKMDRTDDWCFKVKDDRIISQEIGGTNCYQEIGISYWDEDSGKKLKTHLQEVFDRPGGKERYWDQVPLIDFNKEYNVYVRECSKDDIVEIDTFNELKAIDKSYNV